MCEFHNQISRAIAADPASGKLDLTRYCLSTIALGGYWVDRRLPETPYLSGASNYDMATPQAQAALKKSGLDTNLDRIQSDRAYLVPGLRDAIDEVIREQNLSLQSLNLPAKPLGFPRTMILMNEALHEGPETKVRPVVKTVADPAHEPMRKAVTALLSRPGVPESFEHLIDDSIAELMARAPSATNRTLQSVYNALPQPMRSAITSCAVHGGGGAAATHLLCLGGMAASGGAGAAVMGPAMYIGSPALAMGLEAYFNWRSAAKTSLTRMAAVGGISLGIAAGINQLLPHDHGASHAEPGHMSGRAWFESLPAEMREFYMESQRERLRILPATLRSSVAEEARKENVSSEMFLMICSGNNPVSAEVTRFLTNRVNDRRAQSTAVQPRTP
jgi:hypothetical protein